MNQQKLWDDSVPYRPGVDAPPHHLARGSDPVTSHEAANRLKDTGRLGELELVALVAVRREPGRTAREIEQAESKIGELHKRFRDLERRGLIREGVPRPCGITGIKALTWYPTEEKQ